MVDKYCKFLLLFVSFVLFFCSIFINDDIIPGYRIDHISWLFVMLTAFLTPLCLLVSLEKSNSYFVLFILLELILIAFFSTNNLFLFYLFFELSLVPMFFIIGIWGSERRIYAAYKFFLYTFIGSIPFLLALIYLYVNFNTLQISSLVENLDVLSFETKMVLWFCFFIAFAVKIPMWPLHTWLPDAHVEAPTSGSVMLAGILIKLGGYGMLKVMLPLLPDVNLYLTNFVLVLSIISIIYASLVAFVQTDIKKLIAYSSIAHMGFVTAGLFSGSVYGIEGAVFQMLSHGVVSAALFLCVGVLYNRMHSRNIADYQGLANKMPIFACVFVFFSMASIGLPGLSGFVGEFLTILGVFKNFTIYSMFLVSALVLGALYMLSLSKKVIWGRNELEIADLSMVEITAFLPLIVLTLIMGMMPNFFLNLMDKVLINIGLFK